MGVGQPRTITAERTPIQEKNQRNGTSVAEEYDERESGVMVEIGRILCPIDFSEASRHALEHAVLLAKWYESPITALHVMHAPLFPPPPMLMAGFAESAAPAVPNHQAREEELRAWLEPAHRVGVKTDVIVDEGNAAARILEQASSCQADLIAMGTHGLSGFERFMLGSVTEKVLRKATCPVMTVPPAAETSAKVPYTRLLCPVDFSESSLAALRFAFSLAEEADARLTILHVFDWPPDDGLLTKRFDVPEYRRLVEEEARGRLEALVTDDVRVWCKPATKVTYGKPYREILQAAESEGADLIVIGVHGRSPLDLTLFGSTTNQVVRGASCPVLTLKQ
jgi:nucleotide-binding universal stress UspA family protein